MYTKKIYTLVLALFTLVNTPLFPSCYIKHCTCSHVQYSNGDFSGNTTTKQIARERDRERNEYHFDNKKRKHIRKESINAEYHKAIYCYDCNHLIEEHNFYDDYYSE